MAKKIVIFADGTGNTIGQHDSNVLRLCKMLDYSDTTGQVGIYHPGVGTNASLATLQAMQSSFPRVRVIDDEARRPRAVRLMEIPFGAMFGLGTQRNIRDLYRELIRAYEPGDDVYVFGFSRGAFTARALAGLIYRCGVPKRDDDVVIDDAICLCQKHFEACKNAAELKHLKESAEQFKRASAHLCDIRFLGVWDTVKSVGYIFPRNLPHTRHNPIIATVRHAVSISERRSFYGFTTWGGLDADTRPAIHVTAHFADEASAPAINWQDVQEVWFAGDHSDIGGGRAPEQSALANVTLHWMINEAHDAGLRVDRNKYQEMVRKLAVVSAADIHNEMTNGFRRWIRWHALEYVPRRDLNNEPPPPRKSMLRPKPLGPRPLAQATRRGLVYVHCSAEGCYPAATAPWKATPFRFVDTTERVGATTDKLSS